MSAFSKSHKSRNDLMSIKAITEGENSDVNDLASLEEGSVYSMKIQEKEAKDLRRKIDFRIMPLLMLIYGFQFLDKTLLNYAAVMGIKDNLHGNEFSNTGTIFYLGYLLTEPFAGFLIQKLPIGRFLGAIVVLWGITTSCHAATKTYAGLMIVRVLLGIFEAPVAGSLLAITNMWWTKPEQSTRTGLWYLQIGTAQILGSVLSFGFQHVKSTTIESWQILFIFMGGLTILVGVAAFILLPNDVVSCSFLSEDERIAAIEHVKVNQTSIKNKEFKWYQVKELLLEDKQTWILFLITLFAMIGNGAVSIFASVIIKTFGYSNSISTIIQIPSGVITIIGTLISCYMVAYIRHRAILLIITTSLALLGAILLLVLRNEYKVGKLFGIYLLSFSCAILPGIYNWNSANTAGYTKVSMRNALTLIAFCIGNLIGPQIFRQKDAPNYIPAKIVLVVSMAITMCLIMLLRQVAVSENKKKDKIEGSSIQDVDLAINHDLTDIENKCFRYEY